jgi:hypothetical protein
LTSGADYSDDRGAVTQVIAPFFMRQLEMRPANWPACNDAASRNPQKSANKK